MFKKGNKFFAAVVVALLIAVLAATFVGCGKVKDLGKPVIETGDKQATVIIGENSYLVKTDAVYVHDLLVQLKEAGKITYEFQESEYGAYILSLGSLKPSGNSYVSVYHDIDDLTLYDPAWDAPIKKGDKTFHSASLGVSSLPVRSGATYLFVLLIY